MNDEYTPTIADLRRWFMDAQSFDAALAKGAAFDRAMAAHDADLAARSAAAEATIADIQVATHTTPESVYRLTVQRLLYAYSTYTAAHPEVTE